MTGDVCLEGSKAAKVRPPSPGPSNMLQADWNDPRDVNCRKASSVFSDRRGGPRPFTNNPKTATSPTIVSEAPRL